MNPSTDLFLLIRSLTRSEKGYFRKFSSAHNPSGGNNYLQLFDTIDKQEQYDESQIKQVFKDAIFIRQLTSTKYYLYNLILKCLENYHSNSNADITSLLHRADILYDKRLYHQALVVLVRSKKMCYEIENYPLILETIKLERKILLEAKESKKWAKDLEVISNEERSVIDKLENIRKYRVLANTINALHLKTGALRDKKDKEAFVNIVRSAPLKDERKAIAFDSRIAFYSAQSIYCDVIMDHKRAYSLRQRSINLFKERPKLIIERINGYMNLLHNYINTCMQLKRYDDCYLAIESFKNIPLHFQRSVPTNIFTQISSRYYIHLFNFYLKTCQFKKAKALIPKAEAELLIFENKIDNQNRWVLYFSIAFSHFYTQDPKRSLEWINKILNDKRVQIRTDLPSFARLFNLIIHFELGNTELLEYSVRTTYRFLKSKDQLYKTETAILHFIQKILPGKITSKELIAAFKVLKKELENFSNDPLEKNIFQEFDFISWLESKIENRPFAEIVREKAKTHQFSSVEI